MKARAEHGVTLIELLVAITILGILMAAITSSIIVGLRTTDETGQRLAESHDAQLVQVYFPNDVASATDISLTDNACASAPPVVRFRWVDAGVTKIASYVLAISGTERRLTRVYCEDGVEVRSFPVAHHVGSADPVVTCSPACDGTFLRATISLQDTGGYAYSVSATRRAA